MNPKNFSFRHSLFIFILPLIILISSFLLRSASGPFWQYADPSYIYLLNGLTIFQGHPPFDVRHPGTPLQIIIAIMIWIFNLGRPTHEAVTQVLIDPELFLFAVYVLLVCCSFLTSKIGRASCRERV